MERGNGGDVEVEDGGGGWEKERGSRGLKVSKGKFQCAVCTWVFV